jgi:hypothetical protein
VIQQQKVNIQIHRSEIPQLLRASYLFLTFGLVAQGAGDPGTADTVLTDLQRMRPFLERFGHVATAWGACVPIETLDLIAQKRLSNLTQTVEAVQRCTTVAHLFLQIHTQAVQWVAERPHDAAPIVIDRTKLH